MKNPTLSPVPFKTAGFLPPAVFTAFCRDMKANGYTVERQGDTMKALADDGLVVARAMRMHGMWLLRVDPRAVSFVAPGGDA